jgi:hypothetical protein
LAVAGAIVCAVAEPCGLVAVGAGGAVALTTEGTLVLTGTVLMAVPPNLGTNGCQGAASGGCQSGGSYGTEPSYTVTSRNLCADCAMRDLGIQNEPDRWDIIKNYLRGIFN